MVHGKLIVIEGSDASGKETQSEKIYNKLKKEGYKVKKVSFPNYNSESSSLIKMYLKGDFGTNPKDVSSYIASTFYAVDRYASYKKEWENFYLDGGIIISDRYTTSNMIHQASKINSNDKDKFLNWLWNLEFQIYNLPIPDMIIFLNVPPEFCKELMINRKNKITGNKEVDIHEKDKEYLIETYETSLYISKKYNWTNISCINNNQLRSIDSIHQEIYKNIKNII